MRRLKPFIINVGLWMACFVAGISWAAPNHVHCRALIEIPEGAVISKNGDLITQRMVIQAIRIYLRNGIRLNSSSMQADRDLRLALEVTKEEMGVGIGPKVLYQVATRKILFGSWADALKAAGLDPVFIKKRGQWSLEKFLSTLIYLKKHNHSLREEDMQRERSEVDEALKQLHDHPVTAQYLYDLGVNIFFPTWEKALEQVRLAQLQR